MNTKGIKFLAVLAVMVMAFAAIVALAPADKDVTAIQVYGNDDVIVDPTLIDDLAEGTQFYISDDAIVKIKSMDDTASMSGEVTFYVQNGKELELNIKGYYESFTVNIYSVTADQQRPTTSTVDIDWEGNVREQSGYVEGKIVLEDTLVSFVVDDTTSSVNQSVVYTALMPQTVTTVTTSGSQVATVVYTYDSYSSTESQILASQNYATISSDVVLDAEIARLVTVAAGQSIQTLEAVDMQAYGVMTDLEENDYVEYYALGMNAGAFTLADDDVVIVQNGSASVNNANNTSSVKVTGAKGVTFTGVDGNIQVSEKLSAGTMTVSGNVSFDDFTDSATVTMNASAVATGNITVSKTLILKNTNEGIADLNVFGKGTIVAQNEKLWTYPQATPTDPELVFGGDSDFKGQYDVYAITKVAEVKDAFSTALIKKNQTFRVVADTVVTTALDIEGVLIIEPGVTLTISKINSVGAAVTSQGQYAQIINNGDILIQTTENTDNYSGLHVYGGLLENNGKIVGSSDSKALEAGTATFCVFFDDGEYGAGFINNGTVSMSRNDIVSLDSNFNNKGSVSINGVLESSGLKNAGAFTLNNAKILSDSGFTVTMTKAGATFTIGSTELESEAEITVKNSYKAYGQSETNSVTIAAPEYTGTGKYTVRNITVTDYQSVGLELSGNFAATIPTDGEPVVISTEGNINIYDSVNVGKGIAFDFSEFTYMYVSGTFTAKDAEADVSSLIIDVPGTMIVGGDFGEPDYFAAKYADGDYTVYTSLENAVPGAIEAKESTISIGNMVYVTSDVTIPEGMTVVGEDTHVQLIVDDQATIMVEADAMLSVDNIIIVDGMILAADVNNINIDTVSADVIKQDAESTAVACMSLEVALKLATPGDVIELSQTFYAADATLVIPEGVIVDATAADEATDFVLVNSNLIVNGYLIVDNFKFIATTDDTIGITVNGYIYDSCPNTSWNNGCFAGWWYTPFGVSYFVTDDEDQTWYVLTTIENIQPAIDVADEATVTVEGDAVLDELNVHGRDDMPATVNFNGDVDIENIVIDEVTLVFADGTEINTTVKNAIGSITLTGAYADEKLSIFDMAIYTGEEDGVYMEGSVTDGDYGTYGILFEGVTGMDSTDIRTAINYGNYDESTPSIIFAGETTVIGKKAFINDNEDLGYNAMATITGLLYVEHASKLTINSDVQVIGALVVAERSEDGVAGAVDLNGDLFVGALKSDIYSFKDASDAYLGYVDDSKGYGQYLFKNPVVAATTTVTGNVELVAVAADEKPYFITVMEGSVIDPAIVEDLASVDVNIADETWLTIYGYGNSKYSLDGLKAPVYNAEATIYDAYDEEVAEFSNLYKVVFNSKEKALTAYGGYVDFYLDYDIFEVKIKTDGSVKAVYIDGILMETGESKNIFLMKNVAAGTHKVTVEAATGYDAAKCVLYTEMGTILPNMGFTFTEYDCSYDDDLDAFVVTYNINGTEIQPEPVPPTPEEESQWTVTTILLVILVVLIAIMAVIVALRLNRS